VRYVAGGASPGSGRIRGHRSGPGDRTLALAQARRSLDSAGLLLLGEMHGVRENPLLIRALMQAFGLTSLALEWPEDLAPMIRAFLAGEALTDHWFVWGGDGGSPPGTWPCWPNAPQPGRWN
jgi:hypothetical protein